MKKRSYKLIEYTMLLFGVLVFVYLFWNYRYYPMHRLVVTATATIFYALWGVAHHLLEKRLTLEIALEYILIGFFTFLLVLIALSV